MIKIFLRLVYAVILTAALCGWGQRPGQASSVITPVNRTSGARLDLPRQPNPVIWRHINNGLPDVGFNHVHSLVTDPLDANIIYGGFSYDFGMSHGVFKTTDGGEHWFAADTGLPASANIMSLVMDPIDHTVLYAINGQVGLYKSTDQAQHWTRLTNIPEDVWCIAVNGSTVYVGGYLTLYLSTNGGGSFAPTFSYPGNGTMNALWVDPGNSAHVIAAWGSSVSQTTNSGHDWTQFTLTGCDTAYTVALAVDPANHNHFIVGTWYCLLRTTDGGDTWNNVRNIGHVNFIQYDALDPNWVYASSDWLGPSAFLKSTDEGATWNNYDSGLPPSYQVAALALGPSNQAGATHKAVYTGLSGWGIYTTNPLLLGIKTYLPCIRKP